MADSLTDDERAQRRYGKQKPRTPNPTTAEMIVARDKLRKGLRDREKEDEDSTLEEQDRTAATRQAAARGDYKPGPGGGGTFSPFTPKRGEDSD